LNSCSPHAKFIKSSSEIYPSFIDNSIVNVYLAPINISKNYKEIGFIIISDHYNDIESIIEAAKIKARESGGNTIIFTRKDISDASGWSNFGGQLSINIAYDYFFKVLRVE
jgi:hypothetical protein